MVLEDTTAETTGEAAPAASPAVVRSITLLKSETVPLDRALVQRFATMEPSITERPLDESRVDYLAARLTEGAAIPFNWAYATLKGKDRRVNGQHSSFMLDQVGDNLPEGLIAHIDQYAVETEEDLVHIFRQIDARKSGRSPMDVANAYAAVVPELKDIPRDVLKLGAEGINWGYQTVDRLPAKKSDDRYSELTRPQNIEFLVWTGTIFSIKTPELRLLPVVAAMYKTHGIDPEKANKFWSSTARGGDEYNEQDPARALDTWLRKLKDKHSTLDVRPAQIYQACIFCWNAEVENRPVIKIVYDTKKGLHEPKYPA